MRESCFANCLGSMSLKDVIRNTIKEFCIEFVNHPYLCYTEHGLHALFYSRLNSKIPEKDRYFKWDGQKICMIQKEYPTANKLEKARRQNWDISIIENPPELIIKKHPSYDYFVLNTGIEFGLNATKEHLKEDIRRLSHPDSYVKNKFIVHLYRISEEFSGRDLTPRSGQILSKSKIQDCLKGPEIEIYFGVSDITGTNPSGLWIIKNDSIEPVNIA